ncbi:hypothetical protein Egran_05792 [Elaphomyces granulatus]|uniref:DH domain-containing protein n=1 Tax=Elaphomyces granulatus TaxID=519963 RepID=A0A232LR03_9EURO|nr:hypothetical protein Egran_05792 [Elaphomyces granulatus]
MAAVVNSPPSDLPLEQLALYHAVDPNLSSILVFYGPVATANAVVSSSRIQTHIFTPGGFQSYPRLTISPAAPLYAAVNYLPREKQGDEICRGLAVCLLKYFTELSTPVKEHLLHLARQGKSGGKILKMLDETHAADLANRMTKVENASDIIHDLRDAYRERKAPWIDIDVVLPAGAIVLPELRYSHDSGSDDHALDDHPEEVQYGKYSALIRAFGDPIFLPTSRLRRAPSQPTNLSRSKLFAKGQKESFRLAMCEVVDTEERYVSKLHDLVHNVVEEYRRKARSRGISSTSPDESALAELFPPCLNEILEVNMGFLEVIRKILEGTEQAAIADIAEDTEVQSSVSSRVSLKHARDPMGSVAFSNALLEWFPRFSKPYAEYMRAHNGFTQTLNNFLKDNKSSFSKRVYDTGEQKLRSLLMEPVQRLPRYSLLIDTMTSNLPSVHPAVKPFLRARDIITDICSLDTPASADHVQNLSLMSIVDSWPQSTVPTGRLITVVDFNEILPPYRTDTPGTASSPGLMLLYKNCLVLLSKIRGGHVTARGFLAELEMPNVSPNDPTSSRDSSPELKFSSALDLDSLRCMQSACGRFLYLAPTVSAHETQQAGRVTPHALELLGMHEGRAGRLIEEITKAKIEGRFSEKERESGKWTLRSPTGTFGKLGILASVFEDDPNGVMDRAGSSTMRIVFDTPKVIRTKILGSSPLEVIASISSPDEHQYKLDIDSIVGASMTDMVAEDNFISVLSKRLFNLLLSLNHPQNPALTEPMISSNFEILRQIAGHLLVQAKVPRGFRPPSPSKLISTLWGGVQSKDQLPLSKNPNPVPVLGDIPRISPLKLNPARPATSPSATIPCDETASKVLVVGPQEIEQNDRLRLLDQTFSAYVLALRSRGGNIVGRTLRARGNADKTMINELCNVLLEDPGRLQAAAEAPVDVLFVAFETFILRAWRDHVGPVITPAALTLIQSKFDSLFPGDFEVFFRRSLAEMSSHNRRALATMVRLLGDLLDASGNDGDRGALTAAFAEVLTEEGDPMHHISLLDRLVDDFENLFDESVPSRASHESTPSRPLSAHTGSVSSNTSSFRRRFGFGLHRENSKSEGESKVSSLIRTLSKSKAISDSDSQSIGTSKVSLSRHKSVDTDSRIADFLRPVSRDRPTIYEAFALDDHVRRPGSAHDGSPTLVPIQENSTPETPKLRKKRRSSLSDLPLPSTPTMEPVSPVQSLKATPLTPIQIRPQSDIIRQIRPRSSPAPASPTRIVAPARSTSPVQPVSLTRKENIVPRPTLTERAINKKTDGPTYRSKQRSDTLSSIPQPKGLALKERPMLAHSPDSPAKRNRAWSSPQKPQKLRMQSPQKLRERLRNEKKAQASAESSFQTELELIGDEISSLKLLSASPPTVRPGNNPKATTSIQSHSGPTLANRFRSLESRFSILCSDLGSRTEAIEKDLETSLVVSERRAKKLDELYREASAENEALYERFNTELGKVVKDVRLDNGEEALKAQLREALGELARMRKENMRLRREVGGLRSQQVDQNLVNEGDRPSVQE